MADGVLSRGAFESGFHVSLEGTLVYVRAQENPESELVWVDRQGGTELLRDSRAEHTPHPRLSPEGRRVAVTRGGLGADPPSIWIYEIDRGISTELTLSDAASYRPLWTPDGKSIVYGRDATGGVDIYMTRSDGSGEEHQLTSGGYRVPTSVSPDGAFAFFREMGRSWDIGMVRLDGSSGPETLVASDYAEHTPVLSPDGRWPAYVSDESGREEIFVRPFPELEPTTRLSTEGGAEPAWARGGTELFYRNFTKMMLVPIRTGTELLPGRPAELFEGWYQMGDIQSAPNTNYDVSLDGKRFLMLRDVAGGHLDSRIQVVFNWHEELLRLVPVN